MSMMGMDPKMLAGMDPKMLASMGLDPKGAPDPKLLSMMGMDPKVLASMGLDPKMLSDPNLMAQMGLDPKTLAAAMDPKDVAKSMPGVDPKMMSMMGLDPKMLAGMDPKMLASMGLDPKGAPDPKMMSMNPRVLASMGIDPKMLSDPNLMAMYSMGMMPPMSSAAPMSNGIGSSSGTPLPSSKGSTTAKPKPGTVAAALQEKKESEKARSGSDHAAENKDSANHEDNNSDVGEGAEEDFRRGLTSEERVLLREKKKERLMKENESEHPLDEGLNLSVCKPNGATEHPTKLEALLAKPIEDLPSSHNVGAPHPLDVASLSTNGGDVPTRTTEGV